MCSDVRYPIDCNRQRLTLLRFGIVDMPVKKAGETPGHGVEEQQAHNERWAGALCLMGRFIISHYQLIPSDRPGPSRSASEVCKRERGGPREDGRQPGEKKEMSKDNGGGESRTSGVKWKKTG